MFFTIPINAFVPYETRYNFSENIKPIQGDGGARLEVAGRLNEVLSEYKLIKLMEHGQEYGVKNFINNKLPGHIIFLFMYNFESDKLNNNQSTLEKLIELNNNSKKSNLSLI